MPVAVWSMAASAECSADEALFQWFSTSTGWVSPAREYDRLTSDRPHVSEATSTVGAGNRQLETGFTFTKDSALGTAFHSYSYPETLLRVGMFQDWFEFRIASNYLNEFNTVPNQPTTRTKGYDDLYLGAKVAFFKQDGILPDLTIFPQLFVPTGSKAYNSGATLPGVNIAYCWALSELIELECNTVFNGQRVDGDKFTEFIQTANVEYDLGAKWIYFTEFFVIQSIGQRESETTQSYFHTGAQYFIRPNMQVDLHSAVGLNQMSDNLAYTGCGLCVLW